MLSATSTKWAPWYVIPADRKWFARICVSAILAHTLIQIDPQYPVVSEEARERLQAARVELVDESAAEGQPSRGDGHGGRGRARGDGTGAVPAQRSGGAPRHARVGAARTG